MMTTKEAILPDIDPPTKNVTSDLGAHFDQIVIMATYIGACKQR